MGAHVVCCCQSIQVSAVGPDARVRRAERAVPVRLAEVPGDGVRFPEHEVVLDEGRYQSRGVHREVAGLPVAAELPADVLAHILDSELVEYPNGLHHVAGRAASEDLEHRGAPSAEVGSRTLYTIASVSCVSLPTGGNRGRSRVSGSGDRTRRRWCETRIGFVFPTPGAHHVSRIDMGASMATNVHLTPELESFARACVEGGLYNNVSEVVRSGPAAPEGAGGPEALVRCDDCPDPGGNRRKGRAVDG